MCRTLPCRLTSRGSASPTGHRSTTSVRSSTCSILLVPALVTTSNRFSPASAAALSGRTCMIREPLTSGRSFGYEFGSSFQFLAISGVMDRWVIPRKEWVMRLPTDRSSIMALARFIGTANPIEFARLLIIVLMPITSPNSLHKGPPEFPGLMAASVWIRVPLRLRPMSIFATDLEDELTMPRVTVFSRPNGLPTAITQSPASRASESPSLASGNTRLPLAG
mmetsp:Transcript_3080/g.8871  ORF Transcript_3080/g.8871 Transcript_3080/m.8871 type:complete len:222 (-) Transcript_3080:624-1289(-)